MADKVEGVLEAFAGVKKLLESGPLYRTLRFKFEGAFLLPENLRMYCRQCKGDRNWAISADAKRIIYPPPPPPTLIGGSPRPAPQGDIGFNQRTYWCKDCGQSSITIFTLMTKSDQDWSIQKVGQHPPLEHEPAAELKLSTDDLVLYKKALTSRNFGFGVGAVAYLRRVIENRMNDLLDLIEQAATLDGEAHEELAKIADVKNSYRFDDKISYAATALPKHLKIKDQPNPLDFLHDLTSEALHHMSDDECLTVFGRCRGAFEYVFRRLNVEIDDAKEYIKAVKTATVNK
jgi:hypothetical protein